MGVRRYLSASPSLLPTFLHTSGSVWPVGNKPFFADSDIKKSSFRCFTMATVSAPRNRSGAARNRSSVPSPAAVPVPAPAAHTNSHLVDRIADINMESATEEAQLPCLLEEAATLTKSFEALQSNGSATQQQGAQARAGRRYAWSSWCTGCIPSTCCEGHLASVVRWVQEYPFPGSCESWI